MSRVGQFKGAPWCVMSPVCSASAVGGGSVGLGAVGSSLVAPTGRRVGVGEMTKDGATGGAAGGGTADADAARVASEVGGSKGLAVRGSGWVGVGGLLVKGCVEAEGVPVSAVSGRSTLLLSLWWWSL